MKLWNCRFTRANAMILIYVNILFASGNTHKVSEASNFLKQFGFNVSQLLIGGKPPDLIEPQAELLEEIVQSKISQARELVSGTKMEEYPIMVEDSGLFIDHLAGFPGPYSSFVETKIGLDGILRLMEGVSNREAHYRASLGVYISGSMIFSEGTCRGKISNKAAGNNGFGYDPIFIPNRKKITFGQMKSYQKYKIDHRAKAFKNIKKFL